MAAGRHLTKRDNAAIDAAVREAERVTGLQFCVYVGPGSERSREQAEQMFVRAGLQARPAVLVLVAPRQHRVEVVTAPQITSRVTDGDCYDAVRDMTGYFARGEFAGGIVAGIVRLAAAAGPASSVSPGDELPNVMEDPEDGPS
ncbi:MAG TPA: TPM domain-containing protein [Actinomycetota bacterium]|nr:TPM domain-containing protein [Actinomycetota bacterium]